MYCNWGQKHKQTTAIATQNNSSSDDSPRKPRKCLQRLSERKIIVTIFRDRNGRLLAEHGSIINTENYLEQKTN